MTTEPGAQPVPIHTEERDRVLLILLAVLNVGSLLTTMYGARELLPEPMSYILGFSIQAMLFTLLAGFAGQHAPVRKWLVVTVFAAACVYCSFFTYYGTLQGGEDAHRQLALAETVHAELVKDVFSEAKIEGERLKREADELERQATEEASRGTTTGRSGYGPAAKEMRARANAARLEAEQHNAVVEDLEPLFAFDLTGLDPKEIHSRDLAAWQRAPSEWTRGVPQPVYASYVDEISQVPLLAPVQRVREGDAVAILSLILASLVDGMAILLGTAIEKRQQQPLSDSLASRIREARLAVRKVGDAIRGEGGAPPGLRLTVKGRAAAFLATLDRAIHPENGHVMVHGLGCTENPLAYAALLEGLEELGWLDRPGEEWHVRYVRQLKDWLERATRQARKHDEREAVSDDTVHVLDLDLKRPVPSTVQ